MGSIAPQRQGRRRDGFDAAEAVAFDTGHLDEPGHGITGHPEMVLERDLDGEKHQTAP